MLKNRIDYGVILLCSLLFFLCFDGYLSLYVLIIVLLLPVLSFLLTLPVLRGIRVDWEIDLPEQEGFPTARKGQEIPLKLTMSNRWPVPSGRAWVTLRIRNTLTGDEETEPILFNFGSRPVTVAHMLSSPLCGKLELSLEKARLSDYMGLFTFRLKTPEERAVLFYPAVYQANLAVEPSAVPEGEGERYSQTRPGDDPSELYAFREYREGDRLSRIHWKLSQKAGELLVKELGLPISDYLFFLLDLNGGGEAVDALLDAFATLSGFLAAQEIPHRVGFRDSEGELSVLEIAEAEDTRPALDALLLTGRQGKSPRPIRQEDLPSGIARVVYLCCVPDRRVLDLLQAGLPAARLSVLATDEKSSGGTRVPRGVELRFLTPGEVPEGLAGFRL